MPIVATVKCWREFSWRRDVFVAVQHVADFVGIFFLDTRQREFCKSFRRFLIESRRSVLLLLRSAYQRDKNQRKDERLHSPQSAHLVLASCSGAGCSFSLGDIGLKLLLAVLGLLIEFVEHSFLRCGWPVVTQVNFRRQICEMVPQPGPIEKVAFA